MNLTRKIILLSLVLLLSSCSNNKQIIFDKDKKRFIITEKKRDKIERIYFSSSGFALIYDRSLYEEGIVNKKLNNDEIIDNQINNDQIIVMHSLLKKGTPVTIINPKTSKIIEAKIFKRAKYHKIFNVVISKKIAKILELDFNNPYIEFLETRKNRTFVAKEGTIYEEEKKVLDTAPIDEIKVDDLSKNKSASKKKLVKKNNFIVVVADFYYADSAYELKQNLIEQTKIKNFTIKKINNNKYRLLAGPFKNFNALKSTYISLNNLGFDDLNIYNE